MTRAEELNRAAVAYTRALDRLDHHTLTERDIIERNRAERELREAATAFASGAPPCGWCIWQRQYRDLITPRGR